MALLDEALARLKRLEAAVEQALRRNPRPSIPADAAVLFVQGSTVPPEATNSQVIVAGAGIAITGNQVANVFAFVPPAHANTHRAGGGDAVQLTQAQVDNLTSDLAAKLDDSQLGAASGVASLNASTKVVENPANATATPTASKIPIADGAGKLDKGWVPDFVASGASHAPGGVPDPGGSAGTVKYLREDATWAVPSGTWLSRTIYGAGSGNHVMGSKTNSANVTCCRGPGGAGGGATGAASAIGAAGGGGGGGDAKKRGAATASGTYAYVVGVGGTAGTAGANPGNNGSAATTFSGTGFNLSGGLGVGGAAMAQGTTALVAAGGTGGAASGGDVNDAGAAGGQGLRWSGTVGTSGFGGASGGGGNGAPGRLTNGTGTTAASPGGGGGGAMSNNNANSLSGGAGADGKLVVDEST